jgi:hypothetical protein
MKRKVAVLGMFVLLLCLKLAHGEFPYPAPPSSVNPQDYERYLFLPTRTPPVRPNDFQEWKYTSDPTNAPEVLANPHELGGVKGMSVDLGWQVSTGRPDVLIAVLDSGIRWNDRGAMNDLVKKVHLNRGELPLPQNAQGRTKRDLRADGVTFRTDDDYDLNDDGVFNMQDYASDPFNLSAPHDPRLRDANGNGYYDPQDMLLIFSDGTDGDQNGYVDDIAGWNFLDNNNDPYDDVNYGHGTGEARDSTAEANNGGDVGTCPNCMVLPIRVGDSFIADSRAFAEGVIFAVDSGAQVVQEALGTINNMEFAKQAIHYAYYSGVPVIASAADEESFHHNFPAANEHTITVNSVTKFTELGGIPIMIPRSYLFLNGCTNYGGNIAVSVSSSGCSSEATGRGAGIAGLLISAAINEVKRGQLTPYQEDPESGTIYPLTANEVRQLMTMSADDINFPTDADRRVQTPIQIEGYDITMRRFASQPGWDQYFGDGRVNVNTALGMVKQGRIPPEADIITPSWWETIDPEGFPITDIYGTVAANRADSYTYTVEFGCGVQPLESGFVSLFTSGTRTEPINDGLLARMDTARVAQVCRFNPSLPPQDHDSFTVTLRVRTTDNRGRRGEARKTIYIHHDADLLPGFPINLGGSGDAGPAVVRPPDAKPFLAIPTSDGVVYGLNPEGSTVPGWPVHTDPLPIHKGSRAFQTGQITTEVYEPISPGGISVGDLDGDGVPEIVATTLSGKVYAWDAYGKRKPGFPVSTNPVFSQPAQPCVFSQPCVRDQYNRLQRGIVAPPMLADLDKDGSLEIIVGALDRHLYVWRYDGKMQSGFPVLMIDRTMMEQIDPVTHKVTPKRNERGESVALQGTKILSAPAVGDIDGDGQLEIILGTNEEYREEANFHITTPIIRAIFELLGGSRQLGANGRVYAVPADGNDNPDVADNPAGPFKKGWPAQIAILEPALLPWIEGVTAAPALADLDGDGTLVIGISSVAGPAYLLKWDGSSYFGNDPMDGKYRTFAIDFPITGPTRSNSTDHPSITGLGSGAFAYLDDTGRLAYIAPGTGLGKAIDAALPAEQLPHDNHLSAWDARTGEFLPYFPRVMDDMQFFNRPAVADINGDGLPEIIQGSGGYIFHAFDVQGREPLGWPKFTGGWITSAPAVGDLLDDGRLYVAGTTREGNLYVWRTQGRMSVE